MNLGQYSEARFGQDLVEMLMLVVFLKLMLRRDSEIVIYSRFVNCELWSCDMNSTLGSVVPLAMFLIYEMALLFGHHMAILAHRLPWIY